MKGFIKITINGNEQYININNIARFYPTGEENEKCTICIFEFEDACSGYLTVDHSVQEIVALITAAQRAV